MLEQLRGIAHHLDPVVTVGDKGLSDTVKAELERALTDHELIKVRINSSERDERKQIGDALAGASGAAIIQRIGKVVVLYRANPKANPKLSNIRRYS